MIGSLAIFIITHQLIAQLVVFLRIPSISGARLMKNLDRNPSPKERMHIPGFVWTRSMGFGIFTSLLFLKHRIQVDVGFEIPYHEYFLGMVKSFLFY